MELPCETSTDAHWLPTRNAPDPPKAVEYAIRPEAVKMTAPANEAICNVYTPPGNDERAAVLRGRADDRALAQDDDIASRAVKRSTEFGVRVRKRGRTRQRHAGAADVNRASRDGRRRVDDSTLACQRKVSAEHPYRPTGKARRGADDGAPAQRDTRVRQRHCATVDARRAVGE
eukprot:125011-Prymnesium_polylepis.2